MKRITATLLALSMLLLTACSTGSGTSAGTTSGNSSEESSSAETSAVTEEIETLSNDVAMDEIITEGTFENGTYEPWGTYSKGGAFELGVENNELCVNIERTGTVEYGVQVYCDGIPLYKKGVYKVEFDIHSTVPRQIEYRIQKNGGDFRPYSRELIDVTEEPQHIKIEFTMEEDTDLTSRFVLNMGKPIEFIESKSDEQLPPHKIYVDNVSVIATDVSKAEIPKDAVPDPDILVDQIGYEPDATKIAIFRGNFIGKTFDIVDAASGKVVYSGEATMPQYSDMSREMDAKVDFSDFNKPGTYKIKSDKLGESFEFTIGENVYGDVSKSLVNMLFMQRCGVAATGDYAHKACHTDMATVYGTTDKIDVTGGWHDAGDYGRYVVAGAKTVGDLFIAYNCNPAFFDDNAGIPESGDGVPDILNEIRYELEWMLKMQNSEGGVYHKVTCANFPEEVLPDQETEELIVAPVSTTATGDFAAVTARASTCFAKYDKDFADKCLAASEKAYAFLEKNGKIEFKNPSDIATGEYGDSTDTDERAWAAAELFAATGNEKYGKKASELISAAGEGLGWASVGYYACYSYAMNKNADPISAKAAQKIIFTAANKAVTNASIDGYFSATDGYAWGSNMDVANSAMILQMANRIKANETYTQVADEQLHYLFGRNPVAYCYVTGFGVKTPEHTHHRPSQATGITMPGMLVGGPDSALEDPYAQTMLNNKAPQKCYADNSQSYSTNEITIYWNSPLIAALAMR